MSNAAVRSEAAPVTVRKRRRGRVRITSAATTAKKAEAAGATSGDDVEISVPPTTLKAFTYRRAHLKGMLEKVGRALVEAERSKMPRSLRFEVGPDHTITVVTDTDLQAKAKTKLKSNVRPTEQGDALDRALAAARARGSKRTAEILAEPEMLTAETFADRIGISHTTVHDRRRKHEVLGLQGAKRGYRFPHWQLTETGGTLPGLPVVFEILGDHPWTVYRFLLTGHGELEGRTGLQALKSGDLDAAFDAARNVSQGVPG